MCGPVNQVEFVIGPDLPYSSHSSLGKFLVSIVAASHYNIPLASAQGYICRIGCCSNVFNLFRRQMSLKLHIDIDEI